MIRPYASSPPVTLAHPHQSVPQPSTSYQPQLLDPLIEWVGSAVRSQWSIGAGPDDLYAVMANIERCVEEHRADSQRSLISRCVPPETTFWTPLRLEEAFRRMDAKYKISRRRWIPPSNHEIRQTLNLAQVLVSCGNLRLITFDGDETLYSDGANFEDPDLAALIIKILRNNINVALVTAAGYGQDPDPYEVRLGILLHAIRRADLRPHQLRQFWVFGGEANYLFNLNEDGNLRSVPYEEWLHFSSVVFTKERDLQETSRLLDTAEAALRDAVADLGLRAQVIRKERAVGFVPGGMQGLQRAPQGSGAKSIRSEILEEAVARVREAIGRIDSHIPYCAFNGGADVWVDVGNKAMALQVLQSMLNIHPTECLHLGDQFTESGNDITVRQQSPCIWVISPTETKAILRRIIKETGFDKDTESDGNETS